MEPFIAWICITCTVTLIVLGIMTAIGGFIQLDNCDGAKTWAKDNFHRAWAVSRLTRGIASIALAIGMLIAFGYGQWMWDLQALCLSIGSAMIVAVIWFWGPQPPERGEIYTEKDMDAKAAELTKDEIQKLLGRVGAFKKRSISDDAYRELDALVELEEYLKERIAH